MFITKFFIFCALTLSMAACSKKSSNSNETGSNEDSTISTIVSIADDVADAISDNGSSASTSLISQSLQPSATTVTRSCSVASNQATVSITFSGSETKTFSRTLGAATLNIDNVITCSGTDTRVWVKTGQPLACNTTNTGVKLNWNNDAVISGLTLNVDLNRTIERAVTTTLTRGSTTKTKSRTDNVAVTGNRIITFASQTTSGANVTRTKTVESNVTRNRTFTLNGTNTTLTTEVATEASAPLSVEVVRTQSTGTLVKKTIKTGTVVTTDADGKVTCAFSDVVYDFASTNSNTCLPTSGTITCSVYESATDTTVDQTYILNFGANTDSSVSVSVDGATAEDFPDFNTKGCDLELE